jgi:hypothetical protein
VAFYAEPRSAMTEAYQTRIRAMSARWRPGSTSTSKYGLRDEHMSRARATYVASPPGGPGQMIPNPYGINTTNIGEYNQGERFAQFEGRGYLGGYPDDYVSEVQALDFSHRAGRTEFHRLGPSTKTVYGRPIYREGDQATIAHNLSVDQRRQWQAFFQLMGFKTGPAGFWTEFELSAMRQFMTMANGVPGGGMTVDVLRTRVMADVEAGRLQPGTLAGMLGTPAAGQNATAPGGAEGEPMEPYTETRIEREIQEVSADQGLALLDSLIRRSIGRAPSKADIARFVKQINAAFRADPSVITSVVTTNPATGAIDQTVTRDETDVDPQGAALAFSQEGVDQAERNRYQSMRYVNVISDALGL